MLKNLLKFAAAFTSLILILGGCRAPNSSGQSKYGEAGPTDTSVPPPFGCINCSCLEDSLNILGTSNFDVEGLKSCISTALPAPRNHFLLNNIKRMAQSDPPLCQSQIAVLRDEIKKADDPNINMSPIEFELVKRVKEEQVVTHIYGNSVGSSASEFPNCASDHRAARDVGVFLRIENAAFLQSVVDNGELATLIASKDPNIHSSLYIMTQHAEMFPDLQQRILDHRKDLFKKGMGRGIDIAALEDRLSIPSSKTQVYGTHFTCSYGVAQLSWPLKDEIDQVNRRRAELKLRRIEDELAFRSKSCDK